MIAVLNLPLFGRWVGRTTNLRGANTPKLVRFVLFCLCLTAPASGQFIVADMPVRVSAQGDLATFWQVRAAGLQEVFGATIGYLEIQNSSNTFLDGPVF